MSFLGLRFAPAEDEGYLASVSDLMVGMLFVFIIMLMAFALSYRSAEQQVEVDHAHLTAIGDELAAAQAAMAAQRAEVMGQRAFLRSHVMQLLQRDEARDAMLSTLQQALLERAVAATVDAADGVLRLPESLLFDSGSAVLRPEGEQALGKLATALLEILPCVTRAAPALTAHCAGPPLSLLEAVLVEGHTDEMPVRGGGFSDNWQLVTARSSAPIERCSRSSPSWKACATDVAKQCRKSAATMPIGQ